jgi:hypothetical protein
MLGILEIYVYKCGVVIFLLCQNSMRQAACLIEQQIKAINKLPDCFGKGFGSTSKG